MTQDGVGCQQPGKAAEWSKLDQRTESCRTQDKGEDQGDRQGAKNGCPSVWYGEGSELHPLDGDSGEH